MFSKDTYSWIALISWIILIGLGITGDISWGDVALWAFVVFLGAMLNGLILGIRLRK